MKYLKTFENVIDDFLKTEEDYKKEKEKVISLLFDYIQLHKEKWHDWIESFAWENLNIAKIIDFEKIRDKSMYVYYKDTNDDPYDDETHDLYLSNEDYDDFIEFSEDPELYKVTKKYNL